MKNLMKNINLFLVTGLSLLGGFLGSWGGADNTSKAWRRYGLTALYTIYGLIMLKSWWALTILTVFFPLIIGYGIPDNTDSGSLIGRFWYNFIFKNLSQDKRHLCADICTRGSIALMILASVVSGPMISNTWAYYIAYGIALVSVFSLVSWRNLGTIIFMKKELGISEIITWSACTYCIIKILG